MSTVSITPDALKDIISTAVATAIQEAKKPAPLTDKEASELQMAQQHRRDLADNMKAAEAGKLARQKVCTHMHSQREGGGTHCVFVREESPFSPGYVLCQKCQARIRPMNSRKNEDGSWLDKTAIYDANLFAQAFQACNDGTLLG